MVIEIKNQSPASGATGISRDLSVLSLSIVGDGYVQSDSINVTVNQMPAMVSGQFQEYFNGLSSSITTTSVDGYDGYAIDFGYLGNRFDPFTYITISVEATDGSETLDEYYQFRIEDTEVPRIDNVSPVDGTTEVNEDTLITFKVYDIHAGINLNSIQVYVEDFLALDGQTFNYPYNGPYSGIVYDGYDGYNITLDNYGKYASSQEINVRIEVNDTEGN